MRVGNDVWCTTTDRSVCLIISDKFFCQVLHSSTLLRTTWLCVGRPICLSASRLPKRGFFDELTPTRFLPPSALLDAAVSLNLARTKSAQPQFAAEFTMSFSDDSRIVVKEGQPPPPPPSRPASSKGETRKSKTTQGSLPAVGLSSRGLNGGRGKPDGFGTVTCVHTFPTGLVVSTGSGGTVSGAGGGLGSPRSLARV